MAIRDTQWESEAFRGIQRQSPGRALSRRIAISIRRNPWEYVAIRGTQWESEAISANHLGGTTEARASS